MVTDRAKLEIEFIREYVSSVGCFLTTKVDQVMTNPTLLKKCLVVERAGTYPEKFVRMAADESELESLTELPAIVDHFKSATYAGLGPMVGDTIIVVPPYPSVWVYGHNYTWGAVQVTVDDASDPFNLKVSHAAPPYGFPDYGNNLRFHVMRGSFPIISPGSPAEDGEADREYVGSPPPDFYLTAEHYDFLSENVDEAFNFIDARRGEAQGLVNTLNQDNYTGISEETFE